MHPMSYAYGWAPGPPPAKSGPGSGSSSSNSNSNSVVVVICYTESVKGTSCEIKLVLSDLSQLASDVIASRGPSANAGTAYVIRT